MLHRTTCGLVFALAVLAAAPARPAPSVEDVEAGLVAESGGVYPDRDLGAYVRKVGLRLVGATGRQAAEWSFTILDTPEPNAFALPGGRIFVTRGMLALAGDEAELAAILGHEIGHAVSGDGTVPRGDRARRAAEFAADRAGMSYLDHSGYDPSAAADFLATLLASQALDARINGQGSAHPPRQAGDHPALGARIGVAEREARRFRDPPTMRNRAAYLAAIDGLVWGDGPAQGFLQGRSFVHPDLRFAFDAPAGYALVNQPDAVVASGPDGAMLLLDSLPDPGGSPEAYLARAWVPEIARGIHAGRVEALRQTVLNGLPAARGSLPLTAPGSARVAELTVVRHDGRLYRLTGLHAPDDVAGAAALEAATASFRPLSSAEAKRARPLRIRIHRIARGDDVAALAAGMPVAAPRARFDLLNGLRPGDQLRVDDLVKVVSK